MLRLFVSLYLVISIGLLLINTSSNFLFSALESNIQSGKFSDIQSISQLTNSFTYLLKNDQVTLEQLEQAIEYPLTVLSPYDIGFLPEQRELLQQGQTINLFEGQSNLLLLSQINTNQILQIGPIPLSANTEDKVESWLIMLSYLMLAVLILAWSRPLWRDLTRLIGMTNQISKGQLELEGQLPTHSVLSPLGKSLQQMASRISELVTIQKQMLHAVSHDIRTPLARMKFALAISDKPNADDQQNQELQQSLLADIAEVETLIDNLLSFGRLENADMNLNYQQIDIACLIQNLTDKLSPLSSLTINTALPNKLEYSCDGHLLERAIQNLIVNAQKYGNNQIDVSILTSLSHLSICVEDDGDGIPIEQAQKVLMPFSRLEKSRNKKSGGFGLGLAIVNKIITWHQGSLEISSSHLGGAKVEIKLPLNTQ